MYVTLEREKNSRKWEKSRRQATETSLLNPHTRVYSFAEMKCSINTSIYMYTSNFLYSRSQNRDPRDIRKLRFIIFISFFHYSVWLLLNNSRNRMWQFIAVKSFVYRCVWRLGLIGECNYFQFVGPAVIIIEYRMYSSIRTRIIFKRILLYPLSIPKHN